jgi:hypothetical protein
VPVRRQGLISFFLVVLACSAMGEPQPKALDCAQLLGWLTGEVSSARLAQLVDKRGAAGLTAVDVGLLQEAGAQSDLIQAIGASAAAQPTQRKPSSGIW